MSVAVPTTPRRSIFYAHPQGVNSVPALPPLGLDKSPSLRAALHHQHQHGPRAGDQAHDGASFFSRPMLSHKKSLPPLMQTTPITSTSAMNLMDQTATAPARLPAGSGHTSSKRQRGLVSEDNDYDEEAEYRKRQRAAARVGERDGGVGVSGSSSRHSAKRARHSPQKGSTISAAAMALLNYAHDDQGDEDDEPVIVEDVAVKPSSSRQANRPPPPQQPSTASLKRARPMNSPARPSAEPSSKKSKLDKRAAAAAAAAADTQRVDPDEFEKRFREKYSKAFPGWKFYFDGIDGPARSSLANRTQQLGARVEDFFSASVTHFITNKPVPTAQDLAALENKENAPAPRSRGQSAGPLRSPIKLRPTINKYDPLVTKAVHFNMKIWDEKKLDNILSRIISPSLTNKTTSAAHTARVDKQASLSYLLETERNTGVTHERDPNAQRQDYCYFPKNTYWLLIEDLEGTHAPMIVKDYGRWKPRSKSAVKPSTSNSSRKRKLGLEEEPEEDEDEEDPPWPLLRDGVGRAKADWAQGKVSDSNDKLPADAPSSLDDRHGGDVQLEIPALSDDQAGHDARQEDSVTDAGGDDEPAPLDPQMLRRTASMADIGRPLTIHPAALHHRPPTKYDQKTLLRGADREYNAASLNSMTITSHINSTTSHAYGTQELGPGSRQLEKRLHQQVLTRAAVGGGQGSTASGSGYGGVLSGPTLSRKSSTLSVMNPRTMLRKAKSTTTLRSRSGPASRARLPSREEVKKPGYCENCRQKFEDFTKHISSKRHRRFADNDNNFSALDEIFRRLAPQSSDNLYDEPEQLDDAEDDDDELEIVGGPSNQGSDAKFFDEQFKRGMRRRSSQLKEQQQRQQQEQEEAESHYAMSLGMDLTYPDPHSAHSTYGFLQDGVGTDDPFIA
ncbi:hypothetical protein DL93DRAFT_2163777 [Clavulina sp. PMI_390]|nr:hypothetical protein DL93DRAFT_2163777 [Clavulina sp. PMI_390]